MTETITPIPTDVIIGRRVPKSFGNPKGWENVRRINPDETCIIVLGGSASYTTRAANGYAKDIEKDILNSEQVLAQNQKLNVYGVAYDFGSDFNPVAARRIMMKKYGRAEKVEEKFSIIAENQNPQYVETLFQKIIAPRILAQNGTGKLPVAEACRNLRKLTFVTHCHGAYAALKLEEIMQQKMSELGYSKEERLQIQQQMAVVAHAPACPLGVSKSTMIAFGSANDTTGAFHSNNFHHNLTNRVTEDRKHFEAEVEHNPEKAQANRQFDFPPCFLEGKYGNLFLVKSINQYSTEDKSLFEASEHCFDYHYTTTMSTSGKIMTMFSKNILTNMVLNSLQQQKEFTPLPPIDELVQNTNPEKEKKAFQVLRANGEKFWQQSKSEIRTRIVAAARIKTQ